MARNTENVFASNAFTELSKDDLAAMRQEREQKDSNTIVVQDSRVLLTNESDPVQALRAGNHTAMLTVITNPDDVPDSPIAAVHITAVNQPDPKKAQSNYRVGLGIVLKERAGKEGKDIKHLNLKLLDRSLPLVDNFSSSLPRTHEKYVMSSVHFPNTGYQPRDMYEVPRDLKLNAMQASGLIDNKTASICRSFIHQVKFKRFLEKDMADQKDTFAKMIERSSASHAEHYSAREERNRNRARNRARNRDRC